jgi:hypothetical protein
MGHIVFTNSGEIDPRSISSFGVSVKETDNPIGFFGTGLKYAIAVLLRTGHRVTVMAGLRVIQFGIKTEDVRGKPFQFVTMSEDGADPVTMGFTTELGKKWEVWMTYREISCNCKDEGGSEQETDYCPDAEAGMTKFVVWGGEFVKAYVDRHLYILQDKPSFASSSVEVRKRANNAFYYRGVRVHTFPRPALFTYNSTAAMELTEDRTLKLQHEAEASVRRCILKSDDQDFIRKCVTADERTLEGSMDFHGWGISASETFLQVVGECVNDRTMDVNKTAARLWRETTKQPFNPPEIGLTKVQLMSLNRALDFCAKLGFPIRGAYPIRFVESLGDGGLGLAQDNTIFIAEKVFHIGGTKQLASTLIEEYLHLRHGWRDMTRELQTFLFDKLVSVGEELVGEPL